MNRREIEQWLWDYLYQFVWEPAPDAVFGRRYSETEADRFISAQERVAERIQTHFGRR